MSSRPSTTYRRSGFTLAFLLLAAAYTAPGLVGGHDVHVLIHDNLDQPPIELSVVMRSSNPLWNNGAGSPRVMNGSVSEMRGPNFRLGLLPYYLLDPFVSFVVLQILSTLTAFYGMRRLLHDLLRALPGVDLAVFGGAMCFALLPHYPPLGLTVASLPLLASVFVRAARGTGRRWDWVLLIAIAMVTDLLVAPVFLLAFAWTYIFVKAVRTRTVNRPLLSVVVFSTAVYLVVEYALVAQNIFHLGWKSHRAEMAVEAVGLGEALGRAWDNFRFGQYHVATYHILILITSLFALELPLITRTYGNGRTGDVPAANTGQSPGNQLRWKLAGLLALCLSLSLSYGVYDWTPIAHFRENFPILNMLRWNRFHWLHPLFWYVSFAFALAIILLHLPRRWARLLVGCVLATQVAVLFAFSDRAREKRAGHPTWRQFFAEKQFAEIRNFIGRPPSDYRVVSLGMHPSIALHNGFYVLDAYLVNYPLEYKHRFREIIAPELSKSSSLQQYYDRWGSRCYVFSRELGKDFLWTKERKRRIRRLDLDGQAFHRLGGEYVLSSVEIVQADECAMELLHVFDHPESSWRVYLYRVESP